jgi:O-antigen/teichoic acid export membrane protein
MLKLTNYSSVVSLDPILQLFANIAKKGFFHLLSANFIIGFLGFGSQLLVAKFITPIELGQIKAIQSFIGVGTILAGFGFNTAVLKLCSEKRYLEERAFIFKQNFYYTIVPILLVLAGFFCLAKLGLLSPDKAINKWLPFFMLVIPALVYTSLIMVYLQALKEIQLMAKVQVFIHTFGFIILIPATYFYGLIGFIFSTIFIGYIALLPLLNLVKDSFAVKIKVKAVFPQSFFFAKWSVAGNVIATIGQFMDIFMLNYLIKDRVSFGYYGLATIFIIGLNYITSTVQSIATPYFSDKSDDKKEFLRVLTKYENLMILLALGVSIIAFLIIPPFIEIVYGNSYAPAGIYFRILVLKYFFWSCYALFGVAILGLGKMKYNFLSVSISVPISLILSYFFITSYGVIGAAVAQAAAYFITLIIILYMIKHVIKVHFVASISKNP